MRVLAVAVVLIMSGCQLYGGSSQSCEELRGEFRRVTEDRGTCVTAADCVLAGGQIDPHPTCECAPELGWAVVGTNAPGLPRARELLAEFRDQCADDVKLCDYRGPDGVECVAGQCAGYGGNCLGPPDAGLPDAEPPPDAQP